MILVGIVKTIRNPKENVSLLLRILVVNRLLSTTIGLIDADMGRAWKKTNPIRELVQLASMDDEDANLGP